MSPLKQIHDKFQKHNFKVRVPVGKVAGKNGEQPWHQYVLYRCTCGCFMMDKTDNYLHSKAKKTIADLCLPPLCSTGYMIKELEKLGEPVLAKEFAAQQLDSFNLHVAPKLSNKLATKTVPIEACDHAAIQPHADEAYRCGTCGMPVFRHDVNPFAIVAAFGDDSGIG